MNDVVREFSRITGASDRWDLGGIVDELRQVRRQWRQTHGIGQDSGIYELPSRDALREIIREFIGILFPRRLGQAILREENEDFFVGHRLDVALNALLRQVQLELAYEAFREGVPPASNATQDAASIVGRFAYTLPRLRRLLDADLLAGYQGDPAAHSVDEVLLCYPGMVAIIHHRLAHELFEAGVPLIARIIAEIAHSETGIDIHPGAQIGGGFFIDHGTGVVIGETAIIGQRVRLYQAVTLGAKRFPVNADGELQKGLPRHPIVEDDVVIYAGATVLGRITIGRDSTIGGNVWLTRSVPPGSNITQAAVQNDLVSGGLGI